jgi:AcrR family transcriptional regulator
MLIKESAGGVGKREDPRVKRTRGLIVRSFNELVAEKGHTGLTVQEIAERATINRATFYAHFADQYELFDYAISEAFREELRRRLPESPGLDEETLMALVIAACDYLAGLNTACSRTDRQFRPLIEARVQTEIYDLLAEWIEASLEKAGGQQACPEIKASVVSWAIFGVALDRSRNGAALSSGEVADQALSVIAGELRF